MNYVLTWTTHCGAVVFIFTERAVTNVIANVLFGNTMTLHQLTVAVIHRMLIGVRCYTSSVIRWTMCHVVAMCSMQVGVISTTQRIAVFTKTCASSLFILQLNVNHSFYFNRFALGVFFLNDFDRLENDFQKI